jgi:hypothetical protein
LLSDITGRSGWRTLLRNKWGTLSRNTGVLSSEFPVVATTLQFSTEQGWIGASHPLKTGLAFSLFLFTGSAKLKMDKK